MFNKYDCRYMKKILSKILIIVFIINVLTFTVANNISYANVFSDIFNNVKKAVLGIDTYTVKWINYDGTVLEIDDNMKKGDFPYFDGEMPVKNQNDNIYYTFKGWQPEVSTVVNDITYKALYEESDIQVEDGMEIGHYVPDESLLNIAIMTDPHVPYESRYSEFGNTNAELLKNRIENAIYKHGANAILISGDLTKEGKNEEYDLYNNVISSYQNECDFIASSGNHEFRFTINGVRNRRSQFDNIYAPRWRSKMKKGLYFSKWLGDTHIVALGDDYYDTDIKNNKGQKVGYSWIKGWISSKEIDWLEDIIKQDDKNGITTIVLCHWPIIDTMNGADKYDSCWSVQKTENRIKSIISKHNNVIFFSGHTHAKISYKLPVQIKNGGMFVHAGALTSTVPTYVSMKQIKSDKHIKKYELKYILPTNESKTFVFSHDVPGR